MTPDSFNPTTLVAMDSLQALLDFFKKHPGNPKELYALSQLLDIDPDLVLKRFTDLMNSGQVNEYIQCGGIHW